jgi:hypothetical protein
MDVRASNLCVCVDNLLTISIRARPSTGYGDVEE